MGPWYYRIIKSVLNSHCGAESVRLPKSKCGETERFQKSGTALGENLVDRHDNSRGQEGFVSFPKASEKVVDPISSLVLLIQLLFRHFSRDVVSGSLSNAADGRAVVCGTGGQNDA